MNEREITTTQETRVPTEQPQQRMPTEQPQQRMPTERGDVAREDVSRNQPAATETDNVELLPDETLRDFRGRWERVQVAFVDEPRDAVRQAQDLVNELVDELTQSFARQRETLDGTWTRGGDVSTEDLRVALQRYRSLFNRLLST